jgi:hypothetical protein
VECLGDADGEARHDPLRLAVDFDGDRVGGAHDPDGRVDQQPAAEHVEVAVGALLGGARAALAASSALARAMRLARWTRASCIPIQAISSTSG